MEAHCALWQHRCGARDRPTYLPTYSESGSGAPSKCDRDREVVREAARERIRPVEEAGKMLEWDWGSERLAVAESCLPSRVAEARRLVAQELWVVGWECVGARAA